MFLSAVCALGLNAAMVAAPADTIDRYIINGQLIEKFDGSQLVGKTVSDYKITLAKGNSGEAVVRMHVIGTDGKKVKEIKSATVVEGVHPEDVEVNVNGKTYNSSNSTVLLTSAVYIIDGKKCDKDALTKIKPESIASMTIYKPGSKEAVKLSGKSDVTVIEVVTK